MPRTADSLVKCFKSDEVELSGPMATDFGFTGLSDAETLQWFALLKDFHDHLKHKYLHNKTHAPEDEDDMELDDMVEEDEADAGATDELHKIVIRGALKEQIELAAQSYDELTWPRYFKPGVAELLKKIHSATFMYRD